MIRFGCLTLWLALLPGMAMAHAVDPVALYTRHCAECHHEERQGGGGPPLLPENLGHLTITMIQEVISQGRPATEMPAFASKLSAAEIRVMAEFLQKPLQTAGLKP